MTSIRVVLSTYRSSSAHSLLSFLSWRTYFLVWLHVLIIPFWINWAFVGMASMMQQSDPDFICTLLCACAFPASGGCDARVSVKIYLLLVVLHGTLFLSNSSHWPDVGLWPLWMSQLAGKWSGLVLRWFLKIFNCNFTPDVSYGIPYYCEILDSDWSEGVALAWTVVLGLS